MIIPLFWVTPLLRLIPRLGGRVVPWVCCRLGVGGLVALCWLALLLRVLWVLSGGLCILRVDSVLALGHIWIALTSRHTGSHWFGLARRLCCGLTPLADRLGWGGLGVPPLALGSCHGLALYMFTSWLYRLLIAGTHTRLVHLGLSKLTRRLI